MRIHFVRHATLVLTIGGKRILVDPMLGDVGAMPAVANSPNQRPNPLVPLPMPAATLTDGLDAVIVTHTHRDHFDDAAGSLVPKHLPLFGQSEDAAKFRSLGFIDIRAVPGHAGWQAIELHRTGGQHGTGDVGRRMAPVSGFVVHAPGEPVLYIAGDTIWCAEVEQALKEHAPDVVVLNAGAAQFLEGGPITMTAEDVARVARTRPDARIVAVHMEAINHCVLTRAALAAPLVAAGLSDRVLIPRDGETLDL